MEKTDESYWPNTYILCRWVKLKQSTTAFTKETVLCFITSISHDCLCLIAGFSRDNLPSSTVCTPWVCSVTAIAFWDSSSGIQTSWFRLCFFLFFFLPQSVRCLTIVATSKSSPPPVPCTRTSSSGGESLYPLVTWSCPGSQDKGSWDPAHYSTCTCSSGGDGWYLTSHCAHACSQEESGQSSTSASPTSGASWAPCTGPTRATRVCSVPSTPQVAPSLLEVAPC